MSARDLVLLVDDDRTVREGVALLLERRGRTTIVCSDIESAELVLARFPVTHLVSDVQFSGSFGFEGLHFLNRVRAQVPRCRIVLMTGQATHELRATALSWGAHALLSKPFGIAELESAFGAAHLSDGGYEILRVPSLDDILDGGALDSAFQPILRLDGTKVTPFAFEALARVRGEWPAGHIGTLFDYASRRGRLAELNLAAMARSIESAALLPGAPAIFLNVDPSAFSGRALPRLLKAASQRAGLSLERIVIEITERSGFSDADADSPLFAELHKCGVRFALDDHGSAYSHLSMISRLRPSFIKISQQFGTAFETDDAKRRIVSHVLSLARDFGCLTVLEGIESEATARAAAELGIELVQGFHFGRPKVASLWWMGGKPASPRTTVDRQACLSSTTPEIQR